MRFDKENNNTLTIYQHSGYLMTCVNFIVEIGFAYDEMMINVDCKT